MKLKDLMEKYGEYEVSANFQFGSSEGIQIRLEPPKPKINTVWELKDGCQYFCINVRGEVGRDIWYEACQCQCERDVSNAFLTEEDAEKDVERRKVETLLLKHGGRRWFRMGSICNYYMWVNTSDSLVVGCTGIGMQGLIYFDTREKAEKAIQEIGAERIKNALFEVR